MATEGISPARGVESTGTGANPDVVNIATHLREMAKIQPYALAAVCPAGRDRAGRAAHTHWTFQQLDRESDAVARQVLERAGITRGVRTVLMVKPSLEFFALTFALFKTGAIPVLIDPGMGIKNIGQCLAEAEPEAFIGIPLANLARRLLGWGKATLRTIVPVAPPCKGWHSHRNRPWLEDQSYPIAPTRADEVAAILFTSGSTGVPKGAVYTHSIFEAQVAVLRDLYGLGPGEIDLCTFPLFALFAPALGMTAIIPEMDFTRPAQVDPRMIVQTIQDFGVTNMFGSPALIRRVGDYGARHALKLPTIRRVISAGAPVPAKVLETFAMMLTPTASLTTPYGATESLPVCSIDSHEILGETRHQTDRGAGVCVGRPVGDVEVQIIRISDDPISDWSDDLCLPDGEIGEIVVRGPVVTRAYVNRPESTAQAKIAIPGQGGDVYHRMGDVGYRDDQGRIWFCGRKAHRVVTSEETLFTIPCEAVFNTHPAVFRTALVGVGPRGAMRPVLCVERQRSATATGKAKERPISKKALRRALLELGATYPHTKGITTILFHKAFPVDIRHNAKIFREKLAAWAAGRVR
ncbi:acyl-CoA synthetase (AMP-forming)/AMP-acid ligase II [Singulisphaera acidiphila DSM 18658]|uniref:Acyl-CoA synthetase (AMP-forming)/AMP-acid ligase II n=3 Tax=Singulisphaera acidiphila TaxID=466153 RepID=L0DGC7_SINAD|nr:fatty acid CoA ligase family protein [Singulisphaera acidiphila]AGA27890.1 acyl-CoA synthetase (AMP-forming)/AMP-acid ligase II [Singulisphaera acidiphila DSM 18658]